jgi:hypothetical protein
MGAPFRILENGLNSITRRRMNMEPGQVRILLAIFSFFLSFVMLQNEGIAQVSARKIYVVPVSGTVDPGMARIPFWFLNWIPSAAASIPPYRS